MAEVAVGGSRALHQRAALGSPICWGAHVCRSRSLL